MKIFSRKYVILAGLVIFGATVVYAALSYRSDPNTVITVDEHGVCKKVINSGVNARSYFIPTNTASEWSLFRSANSLLDISLNDCVASPMSWTLQTTPAKQWQSVTYGNGLFVAVAQGCTLRIVS